MIDRIKENIWDLLKDKEVSLVMIFDDQGQILWHRGRTIIETGILAKGCGYCSTPAAQAIKQKKKTLKESCPVTYVDTQNLDSARALNVKSLVILPVAERYFLYVDSGIKKGFSEKDVAVFETLGGLLGGIIQNLRNGVGGSLKITGGSKLAADIREKIAKYAIEEEPVLVLGETGVGKTHVAEMIHNVSGRQGTFVVVNTPGIPDTLLEAQLFGHCKGAFSGAVADSQGFVAAAEHGTLFLDEIAELLPPLQAKLLRFMDTKKYNRLGETRERTADVRILAATNQELQEAIAKKSFREDLFFRLNCLSILIPPLRERREDVLALIEENRSMLRGKALSAEALAVLQQYRWPGNVRELLQALKVVGIHFSGPSIGREIQEVLAFHGSPQAGGGDDKVDRAWRELLAGESFWESVKKPFLRRDLNREEVIAILDRGLRETSGKYIGLLKLFHLKESEYKSFMGFLYENDLKSK